MNGKKVFLVMMAFILSLSLGSFAFAGDREDDKERKDFGEFDRERFFDRRAFEPRFEREAFFEEEEFFDDFGIFGARKFFDEPRRPGFRPFFGFDD
jgi:hypothetical protein